MDFLEDYNLIVAPSFDPRFTPAPIPDAGVFDAPTYMICINAEWWGHVEGVIDRLTELDAWKADTVEEKRNAVDSALRILTEIGKRIECGMSQFQLRQSPSDPCVLQQSFDGGLSWENAFDYSLCSTGGTSVTEINITNNLTWIEELNVKYDIDINLIGSKLLPDDDATNAALCHALPLLIIGVLQGVLERLRTDNNQQLTINAINYSIAIVASFVFGTPLTAIATSIGVAVALISEALANSYEESELEVIIGSESVIAELQCCAYNAIVDTKPTELSFQAMFDGMCDMSPQALSVLPLLQVAVESRDVFLTFLEGANQAYEYAENGVLGNSCDEICNTWCYTFDFTIDDGGWELNENPRGLWVDGVGWTATSTPSLCGIYIVREFPEATITSLEANYDLVSSDGTRIMRSWAVNNDVVQFEPFESPASGTDLTAYGEGNATVDRFDVSLRLRGGGCLPETSGIIKSITVRGEGINPFGVSNC